MKTTSTAQYLRSALSESQAIGVGLGITTYPAAAARTSWRLARVNRDRTPENTRVNTRSTPIMTAVVALVKLAVRVSFQRI